VRGARLQRSPLLVIHCPLPPSVHLLYSPLLPYLTHRRRSRSVHSLTFHHLRPLPPPPPLSAFSYFSRHSPTAKVAFPRLLPSSTDLVVSVNSLNLGNQEHSAGLPNKRKKIQSSSTPSRKEWQCPTIDVRFESQYQISLICIVAAK
jgi:hypothetical protein